MVTLDGQAHSPLQGRPTGRPASRRAAPPTGGRIKAEPGAGRLRTAGEGSPAAGAPGGRGRTRTHPGLCSARKMLRERTVRLQYGSRVEAVYVLGTHLWTDVYR